jgi:RNA polymerase sigma-70 factor (family 1)
MSLTDKFKIIIPPQDIRCNPEYISRLADGDREAFAWIYKNYCKKIYDYALLMTNNVSLSEDLVQEIFLKLWQHKEKLKGIENFNSYFYMIMKNLIIDFFKVQEKERANLKELSYIMKIEVSGDLLIVKETEKLIDEAIEKLPRQQKMVYQLLREHAWKREKIATTLKLSPNTVKVHMQKALKSLKENVRERMPE